MGRDDARETSEGRMTRDFWAARWKESAATGMRYDVTKTWSVAEKNDETNLTWAQIRNEFEGCKHVVDWGCGLGRFCNAFRSLNMSYTGVDILPEIIHLLQAREAGFRFYLYTGRDDETLPRMIDGDCLFLSHVVQHLDNEAVLKVLRTTKAKKVIVLDGAWKSDAYTLARDEEAYGALLELAGFTITRTHVFQTSRCRYKLFVGTR